MIFLKFGERGWTYHNNNHSFEKIDIHTGDLICTKCGKVRDEKDMGGACETFSWDSVHFLPKEDKEHYGELLNSLGV